MQRLYDTIKYFFLIALILCFPLLSANELPDLGSSASLALSPNEEHELGYEVVQELKAHSLIYDDVIVERYLKGLGYRLISTDKNRGTPYHFFVVNDATINAFALPGGYIGVNTGLLVATDSESELASVMAHEIGHVKQRHLSRMFEHAGKIRLTTIAGMIVSMILAAHSPELAQGAIAATLGGGQQAMINYTREHEKEADYVGIEMLAKAGFDPTGMATFFQRMHQDTRFYTNHFPEYFMTHPLTENRIMTALSRAKVFPYKQVPDSLQYHLIQARVRLHAFASAQKAALYFANLLKKGNYRNELGTRYGYALALMAQGKNEEAKPHIAELINIAPNQALFQLAMAQCERNQGQLRPASNRLVNILKNHPNDYPIVLTHCQWLIQDNAPYEAIRLLKQQIVQKSDDAHVWDLLSQAYANSQQPFQAHLALAHSLKMQGNLNAAATQLKLAKKIAKNADQKNQVESALKEVERKNKG